MIVTVEPIRWSEGGLHIIDQTRLPLEYREIELKTLDAVWEAIKMLRVRGAPAIGICAAFGVLVAVKEQHPSDAGAMRRRVAEAAGYLATSRPTAVNLFWALDRMKRAAEGVDGAAGAEALWRRLESEAVEICEDDKARCRAIGQHGAPLIRDGYGVLTHCNAGALATGAYGTALAVMYSAQEAGTSFRVFADETRPLLQGARLTAWELTRAGIDVTLICDNTAAQVMREGRIQVVVVGADRIAANGDTANKIGTYNVALIAKAHGVPFYVAAPLSTFDRSLPSGESIPIEERDPGEVTEGFGRRTAPEGVQVYSPAFDVTPAPLIAGIITERGILKAPYDRSIAEAFGKAPST
ncbi:MAG: S-methyl-5-thioribose-1-phosphate isomerase [Candidatus Hydrogenedentes bacterium]|nr:S-methyl-5-thioribose-1-phosphate isomerase [Candidatus Hydrogenedentota bacterium]